MQNQISRRQALHLLALGGLGGLAAACGTQATPTPLPTATPIPPTQLPPTLLPATLTSVPPTNPPLATATTAAPTNVPPTATVTSNALPTNIARAASEFLAALDDAQRAKATYAFDNAERTRWHWTTPRGFPRNGLPLREMNQEQRTRAMALLQASVSPEGFQKTLDIISLQNDLGNDPELYYVTVFGDPGASAPWGWRFEGHHVSRHITIKENQIAVTPFFHGAWPTVTKAGLKAMEREEWAARELITSLEGAQRATAWFQQRTLTQHVTWNQPFVTPLDPVGLLASEMNENQRALVTEIIRHYLGSLPRETGDALRAKLEASGWENIRFGWAGALEPRHPYYYRLQGPTFLLEHDNSRNGGTHIHSVWRDYAEDFGKAQS